MRNAQANVKLSPPRVPAPCPLCKGEVRVASWGRTPEVKWEQRECRKCGNTWFEHEPLGGEG